MVSQLDKQLHTQPTEVRFCTRCVVSNQRPRTEFDAEGVCNACLYAEYKKTIDWDARASALRALCDKHRSSDGSFDVVVPGSGGKDSGYAAHLLKQEYGMHPLCVTWAPFEYTDIGWKNFQDFVKSGFTVLNCFPNGDVHRKLAKIAFEQKGDALEPFLFGQKAFAFHIALKWKIPLIFYGENGEVEYGGSMQNAHKPFESVSDWEKLYFKGAGVDALLQAGVSEGVFTKEEAKDKTFDLYRTPPLADIQRLGAEMHWLSYYTKWVPLDNFAYAKKHTGFTPDPDGRTEGTYSNYAGLDDKSYGFHYYLGYLKFGLGRASRDAMMEIRSGNITRKEGVELVRKYDGEFPQKYFPWFLNYLGITEEEFTKVVDAYRPPHLWEKVGGEWKLKHQVSA